MAKNAIKGAFYKRRGRDSLDIPNEHGSNLTHVTQLAGNMKKLGEIINLSYAILII